MKFVYQAILLEGDYPKWVTLNSKCLADAKKEAKDMYSHLRHSQLRLAKVGINSSNGFLQDQSYLDYWFTLTHPKTNWVLHKRHGIADGAYSTY